jgi:TPR repeat protein
MVVAQARRMGLSTAVAECPTDSLFALADAARYLGDLELGRRTLVALSGRSRDDASKAAFFLGRLEESRGNFQQALDWYGRAAQGGQNSLYSREAQDGSVRVEKVLQSPPSPAGPR